MEMNCPIHVACILNEPDHIYTLFNSGIPLYRLNKQRETAIHTALRLNREDCVNVFKRIFNRELVSQQYDFVKHLSYLLEVYDRDGYTILHRSILNNNIELTRAILNFCLDNDIDACDIEVLGNGDTILHIAYQNNLFDMANLIIELIPNSVNYANYAGLLPLAVQRISRRA